MSVKFNTILGLLVALLLGLLINRYFFSSSALINGERAPGFSATLMNGEPFALKDLRGHYVLLDFWGSWCAPCRQANPELVALHRKYRDARFEDAEGFRIVSVGLENSVDSWQRAIEEDQLDWPYHIIDTSSDATSTGEASIPVKYEVEEVPTSFLLNPGAVIIGIDLTAAELEKLMEEKRIEN